MTTATDYLKIAKSWLGTAEVPGIQSNPKIKEMWFALTGGHWFWDNFGGDDSKLPWCGAFVAYTLQNAGAAIPQKYARAMEWVGYGIPSSQHALGAIAVLKRDGGGHVGFVTGINMAGTMVRILGANQDDAVNERWFSVDRLAAVRQPAGIKLALAPIAYVGEFSKSEA
jgi:uncharacterized protein (TIGR02594 family)